MEEKIAVYITIDINGDINLIPESRGPLRKTNIEWLPRFMPYEGFFLLLDDGWFPQVKWEDEEPTKAELIIKIKD